MRTIRDSLIYWDEIFFVSIFQRNHRRMMARLITAISHTGDGYFYPLAAFAVWLSNRRLGEMIFWSALTAFAIELPVYKVMKHTIRRDRPCDALNAIERRIHASDRFSFPSGHTAGAFLMATLVTFVVPVLGPICFAWAVSVGFARIYLGVHYPTDVLVGAALGYCSAATGLLLVT